MTTERLPAGTPLMAAADAAVATSTAVTAPARSRRPFAERATSVVKSLVVSYWLAYGYHLDQADDPGRRLR